MRMILRYITGYKPNNFINDPVLYMNGEPMNVVDNVDILGVNFSSTVRYDNHVKSRVQKCKRSMYSMSNIGMCYPGLNSSSKIVKCTSLDLFVNPH